MFSSTDLSPSLANSKSRCSSATDAILLLQRSCVCLRPRYWKVSVRLGPVSNPVALWAPWSKSVYCSGVDVDDFQYYDCGYNRFYTFFSQHFIPFRINLKQGSLGKWLGEEMKGRWRVHLDHQAAALTVKKLYASLSALSIIYYLFYYFFKLYLVFDSSEKTEMRERNNSMHWKKIILHVAKLCIQQVLKVSCSNIYGEGACKPRGGGLWLRMWERAVKEENRRKN